jgi:hypothetical protein
VESVVRLYVKIEIVKTESKIYIRILIIILFNRMLLKLIPFSLYLVEATQNSTNTIVNYDETQYKNYVNALGIIVILQLFILFGLPCYK